MNKTLRRIGATLLLIFIVMNVIAFFHAYKFTHFSASTGVKKTADPKQLSTGGKIKTLFFGIDHPRPVDDTLPSHPYETIRIQSNKLLECWSIRTDSVARGTVIIFHGYGGKKSSMLNDADELLRMGYNTLLVDFMGSGGSEGDATTIGVKESQEVKDCYQYLGAKGERNIILFGTSMGAAAILKSMHEDHLRPAAIIIECPFGTMYQTVCARFRLMHVPAFPMAGMLMFWGGTQNGFWAFSHNPTEYAKSVDCPALLLWGEQDDKVSRAETDEIFANMKGPKSLATYPHSGHENYLHKDKEKWLKDVGGFLDSLHVH